MKITFDIDCTPQEARAFLGLPDLGPLQDKMMAELERKMLDNLQTLDPESFMKTWMPLTLESLGEMQKFFWAQMGVDPRAAAVKTPAGKAERPASGKADGK